MTALLLKDVSKLLGIRPHRIDHAIASGLVEEPKIRVANRRVFQKEHSQCPTGSPGDRV